MREYLRQIRLFSVAHLIKVLIFSIALFPIDTRADEKSGNTVTDDKFTENVNRMGDYPIVMDGETIQTFIGTIGEQPIIMEYVEEYENDEGLIIISGRYKYLNTGNVLTFGGNQKLFGLITLYEYTANGEFYLQHTDDGLVGTFNNLNTGQEFDVTLKSCAPVTSE